MCALALAALVAQPAAAQSMDWGRSGVADSRTSMFEVPQSPQAFGLQAPQAANAGVPARLGNRFRIPMSDVYTGRGAATRRLSASVAQQQSEVPEPGMLGLLAAGLFGLVGVGFHRRREAEARG